MLVNNSSQLMHQGKAALQQGQGGEKSCAAKTAIGTGRGDNGPLAISAAKDPKGPSGPSGGPTAPSGAPQAGGGQIPGQGRGSGLVQGKAMPSLEKERSTLERRPMLATRRPKALAGRLGRQPRQDRPWQMQKQGLEARAEMIRPP